MQTLSKYLFYIFSVYSQFNLAVLNQSLLFFWERNTSACNLILLCYRTNVWTQGHIPHVKQSTCTSLAEYKHIKQVLKNKQNVKQKFMLLQVKHYCKFYKVHYIIV